MSGSALAALRLTASYGLSWRFARFQRMTSSLAGTRGDAQNESSLRTFVAHGRAVMADFTPYQQKMIKRYYDNQDTIQRQRLAELVTELYLAKGKKLQRTWEQVAAAMLKLGVPKSRVDHLLQQGDPSLIAQVVKELEAK
jgi:hypothetical protein